MRRAGFRSAPGMLLALAVGGCAGGEPALSQAEVEVFMHDYEADLRARDREGIIARYDPSGAYLLGNGRKAFVPFDSLAASYRSGWAGPDHVAFQNLSYLPAGHSAMLVAGQFRWFQVGMPDTLLFSYLSLVHRTPSGLRIRLEDESVAPPAP